MRNLDSYALIAGLIILLLIVCFIFNIGGISTPSNYMPHATVSNPIIYNNDISNPTIEITITPPDPITGEWEIKEGLYDKKIVRFDHDGTFDTIKYWPDGSIHSDYAMSGQWKKNNSYTNTYYIIEGNDEYNAFIDEKTGDLYIDESEYSFMDKHLIKRKTNS